VASADFPPVVAPKSENLLSYAIAESPVFAGGMSLVALDVPADATEVRLLVSVQAPHFDVLDPATGATQNFQYATIDLRNPAAEVHGRFLLRAHATDTDLAMTVYVRFSHHNLPVGHIALPTTIAVAPKEDVFPRALTVNASVRTSLSAAPPPDLVIHVNAAGVDARGNERYEIAVDRDTGVRRFAGMDMGEFPVGGNAWQYATTILQQFREARDLKPESLREGRVDGLGLDLWWNLPDQFRDFYWEEMHGRPLSVAIHSEEPYIPWELVKPQRRSGGETAEMLGVAFPIGRWKHGRDFPDPITVASFAVIAPMYAKNPLTFTHQEAAELAHRYGARLVAGQYAAVSGLLRSRGVQAIHFAGHGHFDPSLPDNSRIELVDYPLLPSDLRTATIGASDRPLVFVNACEVGAQGWSLIQIGGWADAFCDVGCSVFVGPYWSVNDRVAKKAALLFYDEVRAGSTVGQAMQAIRRRFWEDDEFRFHPTWLAYSLHCHPNVTVRFAEADSQPIGA
jgi:hypothetical protein